MKRHWIANVIAAGEQLAKYARANLDSMARLATVPGAFDEGLGQTILDRQNHLLALLETYAARRQEQVANEAPDELLDRAGSLVASLGMPLLDAAVHVGGPQPHQHRHQDQGQDQQHQ